MKKPKLFKPTQKDLERAGKEIAKNLSPEKRIIAEKKEIRGEKTTSQTWLEMDLKAQSGSIWKEQLSHSGNIKYTPSIAPALVLKPDPVKYGEKKISENPQIID